MAETPFGPARHFPALDLAWDASAPADTADHLLADVDAFGPTAVDAHDAAMRVFFATAEAREQALRHLREGRPDVRAQAVDVSDEHWAERSQAAITPVRVGHVVVTPPWHEAAARQDATSEDVVLVIQPSMGFGTGHHASTRLCLALLQREPLAGRAVIDVGTGSGILAAAAARLGARPVLGFDYDRDALDAAADTLSRNGLGDAVTLGALDLGHLEPPPAAADILLANLTGDTLERHATELVQLVHPHGVIMASGFQADERSRVVAAFALAGAWLDTEVAEDGWVAACFHRVLTSTPTRPTAR